MSGNMFGLMRVACGTPVIVKLLTSPVSRSYSTPGGERVLHEPGVEARDEVGLEGEDRVLAVAGHDAAVDEDALERRGRGGRAHDARGHRLLVQVVVGVAERAAELQVLVELVVEAERADVNRRLLIVVLGQPIEVVAVHVDGLAEEVRQAVVRRAVLALVEVGHGQARGAAEPDGHRRGEAEALEVHLVAPDDLALVEEGVEPQADLLGDRLVEVERDAPHGPGADGAGHVVEPLALRRLGHLVDDAARRSPAEHGGRGPLQHLDGLEVEHVAGVRAGVAHAVQVDVVARGVAAQREVVALGAALARVQAEPAHVAQRVAHAEDGLLAHQLARDDRDRLRACP